MKLTDYLGVSAEALQDYINQGLVDTAFHPTFPLVIFTYSRKCVSEQAWDDVTRKCRGLIANTETDDIVARPFEKFFNYGDPAAGYPESGPVGIEPDTIYEKMDGFLCTLYEWEGKSYIASKGSFDSPHAKWATATYNNLLPAGGTWPKGYTAVFEGITKNLRIVVDYGDREELVLIGLIKIDTGEELSHMSLMTWATANRMTVPRVFQMPLSTATAIVNEVDRKNEEGFVAYWSRPGVTPFRLKIKFLDYLRIHRLVTGVSPKRVYEALVNGWTSELDEWTNESTPWFNHFVNKWRCVLVSRFNNLETESAAAYAEVVQDASETLTAENKVFLPRKWFAEKIKTYPEELHSILFARLDEKDYNTFIWKRVKPLISGSRPMIDASKM